MSTWLTGRAGGEVAEASVPYEKKGGQNKKCTSWLLLLTNQKTDGRVLASATSRAENCGLVHGTG